jgi:DNA-binding SARP family transcriptional activator
VRDRSNDQDRSRGATRHGSAVEVQLAADLGRLSAAVTTDPATPDQPSPIVCFNFMLGRTEISGLEALASVALLGQGVLAARITITAAQLTSLDRHDGGVTRPSCIVTLERDAPGRLLLDLAAAGVTALVGTETAVDDALGNLAAQAADNSYGTTNRVIVIGRELREIAEVTSVVPVNRVEEGLEVLRRLEASGRVGEPNQVTLVVISRDAHRGQAVNNLLTYASTREWCCILLPFPAASSKVVVSAIGGAMACYFLATHDEDRPPSLSDGLEGAGAGLDPPIEVAILGPIEVRGAPGSLDKRPKLTELIVYLAMHPEGATTTTWQNALWPDRRVPPQTVANRLSEARRLLGMELDGTPRLRRSVERHRLAGVTTDWERFCVLADANRDHTSWRYALELVRGRPFDDLQEGQWTVFEGFCGEIEAAIIDCALRYGEDRLIAGDPGATAWAGQRALRASPYDERLHRLLMRAADASGNRSGVDAIYRNLRIIIDIEGDGICSVHPETTALYEQLLGLSIGALS